jgi:hypothetical protein
LGVCAIGLDIVSPIGKMSTKPDQAQTEPMILRFNVGAPAV